MKTAIYNELGLQSAIGTLRTLFKEHGYLRISASVEKPRTLSQNALAHIWYAQVSRELGEHTEAAVKRLCKLHYGVPIMRADDEEFRAMYDAVIKPLDYEKKTMAMGMIPVTSLMNTNQLSRYLECIKEGYAGRVNLEFPNDWQRAA